MRQRHRHQPPEGAGDLSVCITGQDGPGEAVGTQSAAAEKPQAGRGLAVLGRRAGEGIARLSTSVGRTEESERRGPATPGPAASRMSHGEILDLPPLREDGEADLTAGLVRDLERLHAASEEIARTSSWLEGHSREAVVQEGSERVESSRGQVLDSQHSMALALPDGAEQRSQRAGGKREINGAGQGAATMKTSTVKTTFAAPPSPDSPKDSSTGQTMSLPAEASAAGQAMEARLMQGLAGQAEPEGRTAAELEAELREAREALRRLRERMELQTRMYGTVGAQTRKLDQRATELRARVAKAQEALNERAHKLQGVLARERDRLKTYHAKLRQRAKELSEWTNERKRRLEAELAAQRAEIDIQRQALARREAELENRVAAVGEASRCEVEDHRDAAEGEGRARLAEIDRQTADRQADLSALEAAVSRREAELEVRVREFESRRSAEEAALRERAGELTERVHGDEVRLLSETGALRRELEEKIERRETEWAHLQGLLAAREEGVQEKERAVAQAAKGAQELERAVGERGVELDRRDAELARLSAAMEVREHRLQEWQARIDRAEQRLEAVRQAVQEQAREAERQVDEHQALSADLEVRFEELRRGEAVLSRKQAETEALAAESQTKSAELGQRSAEVDRLKRELEEQTRQVTEERRQFADLSGRSEELDRQRGDLASRIAQCVRREGELKELEKKLGEESAALDRAKKDSEALRGALAERERELEKSEAETLERGKRVDEIERRLHQKTQELSEQQAALSQLRAEHAGVLAELEKNREKVAKQQLLLDEAQLALQIDRHHVSEQEQALEVGRRALQRDRDEFAAEQSALLAERSRLEQTAFELGRRREDLEAARTTLEDERAKVDREAVSLRDRERVLGEEQAVVENARRETEALRGDLARRTDEVEAFRRQLVEKSAHLKARKEQLAKDAATVDERLRSLDAELGHAAEDRRAVRRDSEQLAAERQQVAEERERQEREREESEQARRTFQAGLRSLDESRRHLAEREAQLGVRAAEIEALRRRLEEERAELQRHRQELLAAQAEQGGAAGRVEALVVQAEAMQAAVRSREEALAAHEQAIAARTAELSRAEEEVRRRRQELEVRGGEIAAEAQVLESQRKQQELLLEGERSAVAELRRDAEARIAVERARVEERARAVEELAAKHRESAAADDLAASAAAGEDVRRRIEAELSDRLAEAVGKEEAFEARCRSRLEELDRDIKQRLADFEKESRERREQAEREIAERRRAQEEELRTARRRLDEQVDDLRRRQQAAAQEQSQLQQQRREVEDDRRELAQLRRQVECEGWLSGDEQPRATAVEPLAEAVFPGPSATPSDELGEDELEIIPETEAARHDAYGPRGAIERRVESEEPGEATSDEELASSTATTVGIPGSLESYDAASVCSDPCATDAVGRRPRPRSRRRRAVWGGLITAVAGCVAAGGYLSWLPDEIHVRGLVGLNHGGSPPPLSAAEHLARMTEATLLQRAGQAAGMDVETLYRDGRVTVRVASTGDAIELATTVSREKQAAAQECLNAWGEAYRDSLQGSVVTHAERQGRLSELQAAAQKLQEQRRAAAVRLDELRVALESDDRFGAVEAGRTAKLELKSKMAAARDELEAAKAALAEAENTLPPAGPIIPTEEQLAQACAADAELVQAMQQRDSQAREMHRVLTEAMSKSQIPLARLLTEINSLASAAVQELADQTDKEIRRELEQITVDIGDYQRQAEAFSRSWDEIAPKVAAWKAGGDAELLREYQGKVETLIRGFHSESGRSFGSAAAKADSIGRGGSEMTKRRIIQSRLLKASRECLEARNEWIMAARGVVPRYNLELKALDEAIGDLAPRIEQRRAQHRAKLAEHLEKLRTDERAAESQRLHARVNEAARQYQLLSDEFLKADSLSTADADLAQGFQKQQAQIDDQEKLLARLDGEAADVQREIERLQGSAEVSLSDAVTYSAGEPIVPGRLEPRRLNRAFTFGGAVAGVFLMGYWVTTGMQLRRRFPAGEAGSVR